MLGIDPTHVAHYLKIYSTFPLVKQKKRFAPKRNKVISDEVDIQLDIGAIKECFYPVWIANLVVVPKKNGKLWTCMDFAQLNMDFPKESYPLHKIDQMVELQLDMIEWAFWIPIQAN